MLMANNILTIQEAIASRRSIRKYMSESVSDNDIADLMEAARMAPSSSNSQPWRFMLIKESGQRKKVAELGGNQRQLIEAPLIIVCCGDTTSMSGEFRNNRRKELREAGVYDDIGASAVEWIQSQIPTDDYLSKHIPSIIANVYISIEHIVLRAVSLGLGTCWIGAFEKEGLHKYLEISDKIFIVALLTVGKPTQHPKARPRLPISEIMLEPPSKDR